MLLYLGFKFLAYSLISGTEPITQVGLPLLSSSIDDIRLSYSNLPSLFITHTSILPGCRV